jgi:hypothetical protein
MDETSAGLVQAGSPLVTAARPDLAIQGLDVGLFIDVEHCRVRRRVQIQANNVSRLLLKVRIVRGHVTLDPMRLQTVLAPHARHRAARRACTRRVTRQSPLSNLSLLIDLRPAAPPHGMRGKPAADCRPGVL